MKLRKKNISILEGNRSVLIVPQASLAGKPKSKDVQYHNLTNKDEGFELYKNFIQLFQQASENKVKTSSKQEESEPTENKDNQIEDKGKQPEENKPKEKVGAFVVKNGTYGNRQGLKFSSGGPFTHLFEF